MSDEKDYVFTTGWGEEYGERANTFVIIHGTYLSAREEMFRRYGDKWAFQYEKNEFFDFYKEHPEVPMEREYHEPQYESEEWQEGYYEGVRAWNRGEYDIEHYEALSDEAQKGFEYAFRNQRGGLVPMGCEK